MLIFVHPVTNQTKHSRFRHNFHQKPENSPKYFILQSKKKENMNIIIPMAGWGTRLRPHTLTTPKPLIKVASKSIVARLVEEIAVSLEQSIENIVFIIKPEFGKQVEQRLLDTAEQLNISGHIVYQEEALGTAHAIYMARDFLEGPVFIAYADTLFEGKISFPEEADSVIVVKKVENPEAFGVVQLDENNRIVSFVEKPKQFVSDLAIVGIYYFKQGEVLRDEIRYLMENDIKTSGEYQLTDALLNMQKKGMVFMPASIEKWMDFGNKNAAVDTNRQILEREYREGKVLVSPQAKIINSRIIEPCFIDEGVIIEDSTVGPYVSIGKNSRLKNVTVKNSLIGENNRIQHLPFRDSMIGNHTDLDGREQIFSLGDYTQMGK